MSEHERRVTAYHEAGHGVIAALQNMPTRALSIIPTARGDGTHKLASPPLRFSQRQIGVWLLAGAEAEKWFFRERDHRLVAEKARDDYAMVRTLLEGTGDDVDQVAAGYERMAETLVIANEKWIELVAQRLLRDQVLGDDVIRDLRPVA